MTIKYLYHKYNIFQTNNLSVLDKIQTNNLLFLDKIQRNNLPLLDKIQRKKNGKKGFVCTKIVHLKKSFAETEKKS